MVVAGPGVGVGELIEVGGGVVDSAAVVVLLEGGMCDSL
jgi:hypothetical protein